MAEDLRARIAAAVERGLAFDAADPDSVPIEITAAVQAEVQAELAWWHKARQDDLDAIGRLSDERDRYRAAWQSARNRAQVLAREIDRRLCLPVDGDEVVRCSGLHCLNTEFYARLEARGWQPGGMGTWLCPTCKPATKE